jgi:hypothetical protein
MKCSEVRAFLSQVAGNSVSMQIQPVDLDFLSTRGYVSVMQKDEYDRAVAEVSDVAKANEELQKEITERWQAENALREEERKTHSIFFYLEGKEKKEAELQRLENQKQVASKEAADVVEADSKVRELIQKKSIIDRMTKCNGVYLSLTGAGVILLNNLNVRNYRVSDSQFLDFIEESRETADELWSIAERGSFYMTNLRDDYPNVDISQLWSISIGVGKLQGDPDQICQRFFLALDVLQNFKSTVENKMMAAEIMTSFTTYPSQSPNSPDLQSLSESLASLDDELRRHAHVPSELSAGVAAIMMFGRRYDGTYPTDRFAQFSSMTYSYESAAILSANNIPSDQLAGKFQSYRALFNSLGYETSEDTELASAYLSISDFGPEDVKTKMTIILSALRNYLEYPLVAAAILTSIQTLEANETLDLMEKAYSVLASFALSLERSELVSLSVRMIHGIRNELVKELDSTAKIMNTPVQFTYVPSNIFFIFRAPVIIAHSSYYSTFSGIGGAHPAHVHGVGGFSG